MPKVKKKFNPAVRNVPAFKKKKIKVGRFLPHANSTSTEIKSKKITLTEQNVDNDISIYDKSVGKTNNISIKSIDVAISQLGHHNENISKTAICAVRNHFKNNLNELLRHLNKIIVGVGSLLLRDINQKSTRIEFNCLIDKICSLPSDVLNSHFQLFSAYVLTAVLDSRRNTRQFAFSVLMLLLKRFPKLCFQNEEIFERFLLILNGPRRPTDDRKELLDAIHDFIVTFSSHSDSSSIWPRLELIIEFCKDKKFEAMQILPNSSCFDFPVLYNSVDSNTSFLQKSDSLLHCCEIICPLLLEIIYEVEGESDRQFNSIMSRANLTLSKLLDIVISFIENKNQENNIRSDLRITLSALKRYYSINNNKKLLKKLDSI